MCDYMEELHFDRDAYTEIEELRALVSHHFPIYDVHYADSAVGFFVQIDEESLEREFEALRMKLRGKGYIPILRTEGGEHILYVQKHVHPKYRSPTLNIVMPVSYTHLTLPTKA